MTAKNEAKMQSTMWICLKETMLRTADLPEFANAGMSCADVLDMMNAFERTARAAYKKAGLDMDGIGV